MNDMETNQENNRVAETPPTEPVTAGQVLILTGDPGDKATAILSDGQEMTLATIRDGTAQAFSFCWKRKRKPDCRLFPS